LSPLDENGRPKEGFDFDYDLRGYADGTPVQASNLWGGSPLTLIVRSGV
jgi:hypothetical protein